MWSLFCVPGIIGVFRFCKGWTVSNHLTSGHTVRITVKCLLCASFCSGAGGYSREGGRQSLPRVLPWSGEETRRQSRFQVVGEEQRKGNQGGCVGKAGVGCLNLGDGWAWGAGNGPEWGARSFLMCRGRGV